MKKRLKQCVISIFAMSLAICNFSALTASAGNTTDTAWQFSTGYIREKQDSSSVYVKNNSNDNATISVYGYTYDGNIHEVGTFNGVTVNTHHVPIPANSQRLVKQFIHEIGYLHAYVNFTGPQAYGLWSPDSVGYYPYAN